MVTKKRMNKSAILLVLLLISTFIISTYFVSAVTVPPTITQDSGMYNTLFGNVVFKPVQEFWQGWSTGEGINLNVAKILLLIIITLIVYAVLSSIPTLESALFSEDSKILGMLLSLVIGILSTIYLTPKDVFVTIMSYNALGITLGIAIPFLILLTFSTKILLSNITRSSAANAFEKRLLTRLSLYPLWIIFLFYQAYRLLQLFGGIEVDPNVANQLSSLASSGFSGVVLWITFGLFLASLLFIICMGWISRRMGKYALRGMLNDINTNSNVAGAGFEALRNIGMTAAGAPAPTFTRGRRV